MYAEQCAAKKPGAISICCGAPSVFHGLIADTHADNAWRGFDSDMAQWCFLEPKASSLNTVCFAVHISYRPDMLQLFCYWNILQEMFTSGVAIVAKSLQLVACERLRLSGCWARVL